MLKQTIRLPLLLASLCLSSAAIAGDKPHWGYTGDEGPAHWGSLDTAFALCGSGKNQSPINLDAMVEGELPPISLNYQAGGGEVVNNGHTVKINYAPGSTMTVAGQTFELKQFHFHSPSENTIKGEFFPMEAHFVHADKDGNLAVIALMFQEGEANAELEKAWAHMPAKADDKGALPSALDAEQLLPEDLDYYRFNGSLTTPPCSEGVQWYVMKTHNTVSAEQIEKFAHTMHHPNNRPLQAVNARIVVQ